ALLPGTPAGSKTVPNLSGLSSLAGVSPPRGSTTISVLTHPQGSVLASQGGVPLVVQRTIGKGRVLYLAFDPQVDPIAHWSRQGDLVGTLIGSAAPTAMGRLGLPQQFGNMGPFPYCCGPVDISSELSNVPAAALPSLILFVTLTAIYVLLLGPLNFLVLRRLKRREWSWVTIPVLAAICMASTFGVASHLKGTTVLINTIGTIDLEGGHGPYPATLYAGLFAPVRGDYHLLFNGQALPSAIPQPYFYNGPGPQTYSNPLTLAFQEGAQTQVDFLSMNMWSMREVTLRTSANISGALSADLTLDASGRLAGTVHNGTNLDLLRPIIMAGRSVRHLPDMRSGATVHVKLKPFAAIWDQRPVWMSVYGQPTPMQFNGGPAYFWSSGTGVSVPFVGGFGGGGGPCCPGPTPPKEHNLTDRIRDVADSLPETQMSTLPGEVTFFGWTQRSFGSLSVDGTSPQRRDLTLVMAPLPARFPRGTFTLPSGVLGAHLIQATPGDSSNQGCCPFDPRIQPIFLGASGSATFGFDMPAQHVHFTRLTLAVNAGGADGMNLGHVYNWRTGRWDAVDLTFGYVDLHHPDNYLSPTGSILVKLTATQDSGPIAIGDVHRQLQISGAGTVG
ncbi:MAG TPA: hypothetical protein VF221_12645, partial [Chloroflexota bacterium]